MNTTVSFSADTERDRELLAWLERQENKSATCRAALRAYRGGGVTLADVYHEVVEVKRQIKSGVPVVSADGLDDDADDPQVAEVQSRLADLGL